MKKQIFKRLTAGASALLMLGTALPSGSSFAGLIRSGIVASAADSGSCGDNATWTLTDTNNDGTPDKLTISGTGEMDDYDEYYNNNQVPWYGNRANITSVEIADGITKIGMNAFREFNNVAFTSVTIPESVTMIGGSAFRSCSSLTSVTIPSSMTSIGTNAFCSCTLLESVTIPASVTTIGEDAFYGCTSCIEVYCLADLTKLEWTDDKCDDFKPSKATMCYVPRDTSPELCLTFSNVNVTFNDALKPFGDSAYWMFSSKDGGTTPDKLIICGTGAIQDYGSPSSVPWLKESNKFKFVEIASGITKIGNYAFYNCTALTSATIPASVTAIGGRAFGDCTSLTSVTIPASVTTIGYHAFDGCSGITEVTFASGSELVTIDEGAFKSCKFTSFTIPASVSSIGSYAFKECGSLTSVTIPASVTSIGTDAFNECTSCTDVYCLVADPTELTWKDWGCDDFKWGKATKCHVPKGKVAAYNEKFGEEVNVTFVSDVTVTVASGITHGTVTASKTNALSGDKITLTVIPAKGYAANSVTVNGTAAAKVDDTHYSFTISDADVTVSAEFEQLTDSYVSGASLSLKGDIGVNFYLRLAANLDAGAYVTVEGPGDAAAKKIQVSALTFGEYGYKITGQLSAQQMGEPVVVRLYNANDEELPIYSSDRATQYSDGFPYSPKNYFATVKAGNYPAKLKNLCTAMERYGEYARIKFGKVFSQVCELTNADISAVGGVTADDINKPYTVDEYTTIPAGVTFVGATLTLQSETTLSFYFTGELENANFRCVRDNLEYTVETERPETTEKYTIARVRGINAKYLGSDFILTWEGGSVTFSPMTYCYNVVSGDYDANLKNVCKALYLYWQAAKTYFGN